MCAIQIYVYAIGMDTKEAFGEYILLNLAIISLRMKTDHIL